MKKLMNKKGFTLVELLAVIVILAVIILVAMNAVVPRMEEARINAFKVDAETYLKAAQTYYTSIKMAGKNYDCVTIQNLNNGYVSKADSTIAGYVLIGAATDDYKIVITNKEYSIGGDAAKTLSEVAALTTLAAGDTTNIKNACPSGKTAE